MRYKTVLWDLDGTLLNTLTDLANSVNHALAACGLPAVDAQQVSAGTGNGVRELLMACTPDGENCPRFKEVCDAFVAHYDKHSSDFTAPYAGIMETLHAVKEAGATLGIVSNKLDWAVKQLGNLHFPGMMAVCVGEREGVRRKPAPDVVLAALEELGVAKEDAVYIGDSEIDVQTAINVGMDCIAVTWGFRSRQQLLDAGATVLADTTDELKALLLA